MSEFADYLFMAEITDAYSFRILIQYLDVFHEGYLTKQSLLKVFQRASKDINEEEVEMMLKEVDISPNDKITLEMFANLMTNIFHVN